MNNKAQSGRHQIVSAVLNPIPFPDEVAHLAKINEKLEAAVQAANDDVEKIDKDYRQAKRYMAEYRGEIDPHEMFQNELALLCAGKISPFIPADQRSESSPKA